MSTAPEAATTDAEELPFETRLDPRWALSFEQVLVVAMFATIFVMLSYIPLRATDLWCHVAYGQWILEHGRLPTEDPFMPLARGMQVVDSAWLSQVIFGAVDRWFGPEAISLLFASIGLITYAIWARVFYLQSQRAWLCATGTLLLIFVGWSRLGTVRPELFGSLCFAVLFWLITRQQCQFPASPDIGEAADNKLGWVTWLGVPLVFALWANLHGSFAVGLIVLGCLGCGRAIEVLWQRRSVVALLRDREARNWLYLTELALIATLLNPYGIDLWIYTATFSSNPNLRSIAEWQPLVILGTGGRQFAVSILLLLVAWRHSRRTIRPAEVLLLGVFAAATIGGIRMIGWYAPVFVWVLTPHLSNIIARRWPRQTLAYEASEADKLAGDVAGGMKAPAPGYSFRWSLVALLIIWVAFSFSPLFQIVVKRTSPRTPVQLFAPETPLNLTQFIANPPADSPLARKDQWTGQVFHSQAWGDWLDRAGPPDLKPFVTTNIHLVPHQVWNDYIRVNDARAGWERTLDRYRVETIVVDKKEQSSLFAAVKSHANWQNVYEDEQGAIFVKRSESADSSKDPDSSMEEGV